MALEQLNTFGSTYDSVNSGIHRRAASIVGVPSIVRHVGFWSKVASQDDRAREFGAYLADLREVVEANGEGTIEFGAGDLPDPSAAKDIRSGTIHVIRFWWYGIRARIRIEFRTEYVMITSILDMSLCPHDKCSVPAGGIDNLAEATANLEDLAALFRAGQAAPDDKLQSKYFDIARFLQYTLWKRFEKAVLDAPRAGGTILGARFGQVFADFRGIVTGSELALTPKLKKPCAAQDLRPAFKRDWNQHRNRDIQHKQPDERWARNSLRRLWPLIESHQYLRESEFTVSGFLAGRALFVTALGPKLPSNVDCGWEWTPVCNFIHSHTDDEWQLGRLVDRIMNLGTLRLAATVEFETLADAGANVDNLMKKLRNANDTIQDEIKRRTRQTGSGEAETGETETADGAMAGIRAAYADINKRFSRDALYRLERAEHYVDQFMTGAAALRVKRIEGFQKYDEMVARRMSGLFGYVRLLRNRMTDVDTRMSALSRAFASLKAVETTKDIRSLVGSMEDQDRKIEQIQEFGEIALIGFLIPYYVGAALFHYAFHVEGPAATLYWQIVLSFFALIVIVRSMLRMSREVTDGGIAENTIAVFVLYLALIWLVVPSFLHGADHAAPASQPSSAQPGTPPALPKQAGTPPTSGPPGAGARGVRPPQRPASRRRPS